MNVGQIICLIVCLIAFAWALANLKDIICLIRKKIKNKKVDKNVSDIKQE